jgi:hypothetical protein
LTIIINDRERQVLTKIFLQLGLDGSPIISSAYPSFGFCGWNSIIDYLALKVGQA